MEKIKELVALLLADFELENEEEIFSNIEKALSDRQKYLEEQGTPLTLEIAPDDIVQFAIANEIADFLIAGDRIEEIHQIIVDELEGDFPAYPDEKKLNAREYFKWVSDELDAAYPELELIEFGDSFGDEIQLMLVYKEDVPQIKELCRGLNIRCNSADEILKF